MALPYQGNTLTEWTFQEYEQRPRSKGWFLGLGIVAGFFLVIALWTANFLFALLIILFALILFLHYNKEPITIRFAITDVGVILGEQFFPFKDLTKFWIIYDPPEVKKLYIQKKAAITPVMIIPLTDVNPIYVRDILLNYLKEDLEPEDESFSEYLGRLLKL